MTEQYLIAHKVRGEPAFDIAERMEANGEEWWIIPTSGHRAYPYWNKPLTDWCIASTAGFDVTIVDALKIEPMPPDLPEHYEVTAAKGKGKGNGQDLLKMLGLVKPTEPMTRRSW